MSKNIVVLSDGTGQEGGKGHDTNVYKLFRMLEDRTPRQVVFYDEGLGTDWRKITGNAFGAGFSKNLRQCYQFIFDNYNAGDNIFLFGFSRGAATVRSLASFIDYFGIMPKSRPELIKQAYRIYKSGRVKRDGKKRVDFVQKHPNQWVSIKFLGVWDTVPALGLPGLIPGKIIDLVPGWKHRYHDFTLHPSVENAYHALSIDDDRKWFHPTIWERLWTQEELNYKQNVEQVWFSGAHSDVGGGVPLGQRPGGLSDIALEWMVQKAVTLGLRLYLGSRKHWNFVIAPDPTDQWHPPRAGLLGWIYPKGKRSYPKTKVDADGKSTAYGTFGAPKIHKSVIKRVEHSQGTDKEYDPWILKEFPNYKTEPWVDKFKYDGKKKTSLRDYDEKTWQDKFDFDGENIKVDHERTIVDNIVQRGQLNEEDNRLKLDFARWSKRK